MTERRWMVDTNVLLSRLLCPGGVAAQAVDRALELDPFHGVRILSPPAFLTWLVWSDRDQFNVRPRA